VNFNPDRHSPRGTSRNCLATSNATSVSCVTPKKDNRSVFRSYLRARVNEPQIWPRICTGARRARWKKVMEKRMLFRNMALLFLFLPVSLAAQIEQKPAAVPADFGRVTNDLVLSYGGQYLATPRHAGSFSSASTLPSSLSYTFRLLTFRFDATTLKSVDFAPSPRQTGLGDSAFDTSIVVLKGSSSRPTVTADYQLNIPTGSRTLKLGAGKYSHRIKTGFGQRLSDRWSVTLSGGDLLVPNKLASGYNNAFFTAFAGAFSFPAKDRTQAVPMISSEIDFVPSYRVSVPPSQVPTEVYNAYTVMLPLKWQTRLSITARAGITPYTPKWGVTVQVQYLLPRRPILVSAR
jgi:hypothetical protein